MTSNCVAARRPRNTHGMAEMADSNGSSVFLILSYLYPQVSYLKCALQVLSGHSSIVLTSDAKSYQDTCIRTLVACDRKGRLEDFAGLCKGFHGRETRQKYSGRNNSTPALESVLVAVKKVQPLIVTW